MPIFTVIAGTTSSAASVQSKIDEHYPSDSYKMKSDTWFVQAALTTSQLADQLGIYQREGSKNGIVVKMDGYSGRGANEMWEWLNLRWEA